MGNEDIEKFKRYISPKVPLTLKDSKGNEDTFYLKPLNMAQQAMAFELGKKLKVFEGQPEKLENIAEELDKETIESIFDFVLGIVKNSYPEMDEETLENFTASNFEEIFNKIEKLTPKSKDMRKSEKLLKDVEERNGGTSNK